MKPQRSYRKRLLLGFAMLLFCASGRSFAQGSSASQVVLLSVRELNKIGFAGDTAPLVPKAVPDPSTNEVVLSGSTKLVWTSNGDSKKITVAADHQTDRYVLLIKPEQNESQSPGTLQEVALSDNKPRDLIRGVSRSAGSCTLSFSATTENEPSDVGLHRVTYTITGS